MQHERVEFRVSRQATRVRDSNGLDQNMYMRVLLHSLLMFACTLARDQFVVYVFDTWLLTDPCQLLRTHRRAWRPLVFDSRESRPHCPTMCVH